MTPEQLKKLQEQLELKRQVEQPDHLKQVQEQLNLKYELQKKNPVNLQNLRKLLGK